MYDCNMSTQSKVNNEKSKNIKIQTDEPPIDYIPLRRN